jgi:hypothetical protein
MRYNLFDLSRIPLLSDHEICVIAIDARAQAKLSTGRPPVCPWDGVTAAPSKYKRVIWRSVFRRERERLHALTAERHDVADRRIAA